MEGDDLSVTARKLFLAAKALRGVPYLDTIAEAAGLELDGEEVLSAARELDDVGMASLHVAPTGYVLQIGSISTEGSLHDR